MPSNSSKYPYLFLFLPLTAMALDSFLHELSVSIS